MPASLSAVKSRAAVVAGTFLPPLLVAVVYPNIFLKALDVVGGVGIVVLFGLLPALMAFMGWKSPIRRLSCLAVIVFSLFVLGMEIMQEAGLLSLHPDVE